MTVRVRTHDGDSIDYADADQVQQLDSGALVVLADSNGTTARTVALYPASVWWCAELDDAVAAVAPGDDQERPEDLFGVAGRGLDEHESLASQVARLAEFICENIDGEPSQSQGAIDTAIRLLSEGLGADVDPLAPGRIVRVQGSKGPWQVTKRRYEPGSMSFEKGPDSITEPERLIVELVPYDDERSVTTHTGCTIACSEQHTFADGCGLQVRPAVVTPPPTDEQVAIARHGLGMDDDPWQLRAERDHALAELARRGAQWDEDSRRGREQVANLVQAGTEARAQVADLLRELAERSQHVEKLSAALDERTAERDEARRLFLSMRKKRNRARNHAVRNDHERDTVIAELAEVRGERDALQRELEELRDCTQPVDTAGDDDRGTLIAPPHMSLTLHVGDTLSMEDGDGKGVSGRIESWTAAPGGLPFVVVVGADR